MQFDDSEKPGRKAALEKLIGMMGENTTKKLSGLKKPAVALEVEGEDDLEEMPEEGMADEEPSDEDKAKIAELYHKFCK